MSAMLAFDRQVNAAIVDPRLLVSVRKKLALDQRESGGDLRRAASTPFPATENGPHPAVAGFWSSCSNSSTGTRLLRGDSHAYGSGAPGTNALKRDLNLSAVSQALRKASVCSA